MVPTIGVAAIGIPLITTLADGIEVQPVAVSVTVKLYVAAIAKPVSVVVAPVPIMAPGFIIHPPAGNPANATLPVGTVHVGCVMIPTVGAVGVAGCALITIFADVTETHADALITV